MPTYEVNVRIEVGALTHAEAVQTVESALRAYVGRQLKVLTIDSQVMATSYFSDPLLDSKQRSGTS